MVPIKDLKRLREETGISIGDCKQALDQANGDLEKAKEILKEKGLSVAQKKLEREVGAGLIASYIHPNRKIGVLLDLRCETDFVASNQEFQRLARELCLQIAASDCSDKDSLLEEAWIKDESKKVSDLISEYIAKLGENIAVNRFTKYQLS